MHVRLRWWCLHGEEQSGRASSLYYTDMMRTKN